MSNFFFRGRIIGILEDGFVLQNQERRIDLIYDRQVNVGDIVEINAKTEPKTLPDGQPVTLQRVTDFKVLTPCRDEFFIGQESPNYRRMIIDLNLREKLVQRTKIIQKIREFFVERGFLDVETPSLVKFPGMEPYLDIFKTQFIGLPGPEGEVQRDDLYLITSPEYAMKKLLAGGCEKIFQICRAFRNKETNGNLHNPEFTMIEWYRAYADYTDVMRDTEELVCALTEFCHGKPVLPYFRPQISSDNRCEIDVKPPWRRLKVKDAFQQYAGIGTTDFEDPEKFRRAVQAKKLYKITDETIFDDMFFLVFMNEIEPNLGFDKPVILYEYPASMAALSKKCDHDPRYAERFEAYIAGMELCNAFTELTDPVEQDARLQTERKQRQQLGKDDYPVDQTFIDALKFGMPPSSGNALGIDRLVMLVTQATDIRDVLFFPYRDL